jgi:dihydrofolate synthase/folylpolyglutamate synthase
VPIRPGLLSKILTLKNYSDTVNYLFSLQKHGIKLGLSNTRKILEILGEPHKSFRTIHIAGTNGKGSTATILSSILKESGLKVGLFTSPHLISFTERIRINNAQISEQNVIDLASKVRKHISGTDLNPTFFEFVTAMAMDHFSAENVDFAIVETGMGGRFDATNVILPEISIITNIGLDHCEFLGNSISAITVEKAGIIKPRVPVITATTDPQVLKQLDDISTDRGCEIHIYGRDFKGSLLSMDDRHLEFDYTGYQNYSCLSIPLTGRYQVYNACTAVRAAELLIQKGISLPDRAIPEGLLKVGLEGRLEYVLEDPPIILDGAHNPEAIISLAASLGDIFPGKSIILILGVMNDKDIGGIISPIIHHADFIILTQAAYERSASSQTLENTIKSLNESASNGTTPIKTTETVAEAVELARSRCSENSIILITGSFYTTGEAKELLGHKGVLSRLRE